MAKLTFTGDIAFSKYFTGLADKEDLLSPEILAFLRESDHVVANVEGPISSGEKKGADSAVRSMQRLSRSYRRSDFRKADAALVAYILEKAEK